MEEHTKKRRAGISVQENPIYDLSPLIPLSTSVERGATGHEVSIRSIR
jgi:hypothetical protein